jgi:hypothetical protein
MGMDVIGTNPTAEVGRYFGRNIHGWAPLAALCTSYAVEETAPLQREKWYYNDGNGLDGEHSIRLAKRLREFIADGTVAGLMAEYGADLRMTERDVAEFADFLEACGGFAIL